MWAVTLVLLGIGNGATAAAHNAAALDLADDDDHNAVRATFAVGSAVRRRPRHRLGSNVLRQQWPHLKLSWQGVDTAIARDALAYLVITLSQSMTAVVGGYTFGFLAPSRSTWVLARCFSSKLPDTAGWMDALVVVADHLQRRLRSSSQQQGELAGERYGFL